MIIPTTSQRLSIYKMKRTNPNLMLPLAKQTEVGTHTDTQDLGPKSLLGLPFAIRKIIFQLLLQVALGKHRVHISSGI